MRVAMATCKSRRHREFNEVLVEAMDESVRELLSSLVLETLYRVLLEHYDVTRDELPYRLQTVFEILTKLFGTRGGLTIGKNISRRLYEKLGLEFEEVPHFELVDYMEIAKRKLAQTAHSNQQVDCALAHVGQGT